MPHLPFVNGFCKSLEGVGVEVRLRLGSKVGQKSTEGGTEGRVQVFGLILVVVPSEE